MPRFYFHLISSGTRITDDRGKAFDTLNEAYEQAESLLTRFCYMLAMMMRASGKLLSRMMRMILS